MHVHLGRQEAVDVERQGVFPVGLRAVVVGEGEYTRRERDVVCQLPEQPQLGARTEVVRRLSSFLDVVRRRVYAVADAGFQVVGQRGYRGIESECLRRIGIVVRHTDTGCQLARREERRVQVVGIFLV